MVTSMRSALSPLLSSATAVDAPPQPENWPMPLDQFLIEGHMHWADICLSRNEYNPLSWLIRYATHSNFAHVALVFLRPRLEFGWQSTYVIESVFSGIEITNMHEYFKHPRLSVAVRRLNRPWFEDEIRRRVRGRMLDDIKADYAFRTLVGLGRQFLFGLESATRGHKRAVVRRTQQDKKSANEFICSGFIQRGYTQAIYEFIRDGKLPPEALRDVVFDRNLATILPDDWSQFTVAEATDIVREYLDAFSAELLAVTPRDLETHPGLDWVYVITGGKAYKVSSYKDVCDIMKITPFPG
jgi:hypothetical protein